MPAVTDADVQDAAAALAATLETAARGIIYEQRPTAIPAERLAHEFQRILKEIEGNRSGSLTRDAAAALRALERGARDASKLPGAGRTAFLDLMDRVTAGAPDVARSSSEQPTPADDAPKIVLG
ncbi:MAG: hypothetical protein U0Q12_27445 [Vicinamibacterales bacterium]